MKYVAFVKGLCVIVFYWNGEDGEEEENWGAVGDDDVDAFDERWEFGMFKSHLKSFVRLYLIIN